MLSVAPAGTGFVLCPTAPGCASFVSGYLLTAAPRLTFIYFTASHLAVNRMPRRRQRRSKVATGKPTMLK